MPKVRSYPSADVAVAVRHLETCERLALQNVRYIAAVAARSVLVW